MSVEALSEQIQQHSERQAPLRIVGGDSKAFYGADISELPALSTLPLNKILSYEPSELVLQVEAGCTLKHINETLNDQGQMLAFEPPDFGGSTIGGAIASGIAGSRRPYFGSGRDFLLGVGVVDGEGAILNFGGQVMKNVAGYDVSRLMAGALGCLGLITEVSLKVLPRPESEVSRSRPVEKSDLLSELRSLQKISEVSGAAWYQGQLTIRFSGSEVSVRKQSETFGGEEVSATFWQDLDAMKHFDKTTSVYRVSTKPFAPLHSDEVLIDWGGAQRWFTNCPDERYDNQTLVKTPDKTEARFSALSAPILKLHQNLKSTFDPNGILNPNKMYQGL